MHLLIAGNKLEEGGGGLRGFDVSVFAPCEAQRRSKFKGKKQNFLHQKLGLIAADARLSVCAVRSQSLGNLSGRVLRSAFSAGTRASGLGQLSGKITEINHGALLIWMKCDRATTALIAENALNYLANRLGGGLSDGLAIIANYPRLFEPSGFDV